MKRESGRRRGEVFTEEAQSIAVEVLTRLASDPERIGRFLAITGLDPTSLRGAAGRPGFLPAILDHVTSDEPLLLAIAAEIGSPPERIAMARQRLSPVSHWEP